MGKYASKNERVNLLSLPSDQAMTMREQPGYKWYKPILVLIVTAFLYIIFASAIYVAKMLYMNLAIDPSSIALAADAYMDVDFADPFQVFFAAGGVAVIIPALGIAMKLFGLGGLRTLSSVESGLRWKLIAKIALPIFILAAVLILAATFVEYAVDGRLANLEAPRFAPLALVAILLFVPFQCAAEEYACRGFAMQAVGSWIPVIVVPLVLQALVFGALHGYNSIGNVALTVNGLILGWLALKTGGIEASICVHAANNVVVMLLSSVFVSAASATTVSIVSAVVDVVLCLALGFFAYFLCKRAGCVISDK